MVMASAPWYVSEANIFRGLFEHSISQGIVLMTQNRGLDSRYMISQLKPPNVKVLSLTTIATPHRGSAFADYMFDTIGRKPSPHLPGYVSWLMRWQR